MNNPTEKPRCGQILNDILPEDFSWNRARIEYKQQAKAGKLILPVLYTLSDGKAVVDMRSGSGISYAVAEFSTAEFQ